MPQVAYPQLTSAGQQIVTLCQGVYRAVTLASRKAQRENVGGHVLQVKTRCIKGSVERAVVYPQSGHGCKLTAQGVGVLHVGTGHSLALGPAVATCRLHLSIAALTVVLTQVVVVDI